MRNLAIFIALAWFWLLFYGVGPLNSTTQLAVGTAALVIGSIAAALLGLILAIGPLPAARRPGRR